MKNQEVKTVIKESGCFQWEVAVALGVSEGTLCKWLRQELSQEKKKEILEAIKKLSK